MSEGYTKRYVSTGGFRNSADGPPATPLDKATLNAMDEGIRTANLRDEAAATPSLRTLGTSATSAAAGSDRRLTYAKGLLSARPAASAAQYYFATDVNGGTLYLSNGSTWDAMAPGVAQAGSGGSAVVGTADGQVAMWDATAADWIVDRIKARNIAAGAAIPPGAIAGTAVIDSDPRLATATGSAGSRDEEIRNGTARVRQVFPHQYAEADALGDALTNTYGEILFAGVPIYKGDIVTAIHLVPKTAGAGAHTGWFVGIWDETWVKIRNATDAGAGMPTDATPVRKALTSNTPAAAGDTMWYVGILIVGSAGNPFKIWGQEKPTANFLSAGKPVPGMRRLAGRSQGGLTTPPTNITAQNDTAKLPWFGLELV